MRKIKFVYTVYGKKYALMLINGLKLSESHIEYHDYFVNDEAREVLLEYGIPENRIHDTYGENVYIDKIINAMTYSMEKPDYLVFAVDSSAIVKREDTFYEWIHEIEDIFDANPEKQVYLQGPEFWNIFGYDCKVPDFTKYNNGICAGLIIYNRVTQSTIDQFMRCYRDLANGTIKVNWYAYNDASEARYNANTKVTEEKVFEYILNKEDCKQYDVNFEIFENLPYQEYERWSTARVLNNMFLEIFNWGSGNMIDEMIAEHKTKYNGEYYIDSEMVSAFENL